MGSNPSHFAGCDRCPVEQVSWYDAVDFAQRVSRQEGATYRLLTEQEWEAAARGGESHEYAGSDDLGAVGWCRGNSGSTHPVCEKARNAYGLCDMSGNVWEWTSSLCDSRGIAEKGGYRVLRGGAANEMPGRLRVASRNWSSPYRDGAYMGLRLARTSP